MAYASKFGTIVSVKETITLATGFSRAKIIPKESNWILLDFLQFPIRQKDSQAMDVQKLTHEVRLQQWSKTVKDCRSSGKSVKSWCDGQNININTYYYWQKKICLATCRDLAMNHPRNFHRGECEPYSCV